MGFSGLGKELKTILDPLVHERVERDEFWTLAFVVVYFCGLFHLN